VSGSATALLSFAIGPVHSFIAQARRIADLWAGSDLLSHLARQAVSVVHQDPDCAAVYPFFAKGEGIPDGIPNRIVCRVPASRATECARAMETKVREEWSAQVEQTVEKVLSRIGLTPAETLWTRAAAADSVRQTDTLLEIAWSWVPEERGYAAASREGAERFAGARLFRPFQQSAQGGEKCALCGERTALPNGRRSEVERAWAAASEIAAADEDPRLASYLRYGQGRLCLVCATKRFYTYTYDHGARRDRFVALDRFQPLDESPYLALVKMDGDHMGSLLRLDPACLQGGDLEQFHRVVSLALTRFAAALRKEGTPDLNLQAQGLRGFESAGRPPQLLYAGGDDLLFVCDPRDALPLVARLRAAYQEGMREAAALLVRGAATSPFTISAAVLFAHSGHPAGLLMRDLEILLKERAKESAGRNALAVRVAKGGGPTEVSLPWDDIEGRSWPQRLDDLVAMLRRGALSSGQTFSLRLEETVLGDVLLADQWEPWLAERLSRRAAGADAAAALAHEVAPFLAKGKGAALRIARFLGREVVADPAAQPKGIR
jgi:CRISPR-associated protein Cmr2